MKAQIQFGESIMVIIVLVFVLVIGMVFYYNATKESLERELTYREDIDAIKLAKSVLSLPEIQCGAFIGAETCIDKVKLLSLSELLTLGGTNYDPAVAAYYNQLFGYATVQVHLVSGAGTGSAFTLFTDKPPTISSQLQQFIFTTLYDPLTQTHDLAYLNVTRYTIEVVS